MTKRFVEKVGGENVRIPLRPSDGDMPVIDREYILVVPSYGAGRRSNAVPKQVISFLNIPQNREWLRGVVGSGSTNYGSKYALGAKVVAAKTGTPLLHTYELLGLPEDVLTVQNLLKEMINEPREPNVP